MSIKKEEINRLLRMACECNDHTKALDIAKFAIKHFADVNYIDSNNKDSLLVTASKRNNLKMIEFLFDNDYKLRLSDLSRSISSKVDLEIIKLIINKGAEVSPKSKVGHHLPLHQAVSYGRMDIAILLLSEGADINQQDDYHGKDTAIMKTTNPLMINLLYEYGANLFIRDDRGETRYDQLKRCTSENRNLVKLIKKLEEKSHGRK